MIIEELQNHQAWAEKTNPGRQHQTPAKFNSLPLKSNRDPKGKDRLPNYLFSGPGRAVKLQGCIQEYWMQTSCFFAKKTSKDLHESAFIESFFKGIFVYLLLLAIICYSFSFFSFGLFVLTSFGFSSFKFHPQVGSWRCCAAAMWTCLRQME